MAGKERPRYCAVYTRKSSEEGLEQEFNSLDAQREAGQAYIKSQTSQGWRLVKTRYDDGGYSGGSLERPGLQRLLCDITAGKVNVVVVYKVDRLTRSLRDFARLIEVLEDNDASFVSVTQQFNTTTSMGRLMLNVLLSFAQFEREVTGERIRDKIAASKKKGMWMGGTPPIGYVVRERHLIPEPAGVSTVRHIFTRYAEIGRIGELVRELERRGYRTRVYTSASGRQSGGRPFSRGHVHRILTSRIYLGEIVHGDTSYPGEHEAIIGPELWNTVQERLEENRRGGQRTANQTPEGALRGRLFDDRGNAMSPVQSRRGQRRYCYYVSQALLKNEKGNAGSVPRLPAHELDTAVARAVEDALASCAHHRPVESMLDACRRLDEAARLRALTTLTEKVVVHATRLRITLDRSALGADIDYGEEGEEDGDALEALAQIEVPLRIERRRGSTRILAGPEEAGRGPGPDAALLKALARGYLWSRQLREGHAKSVREIAERTGVTPRYVSRMMRMAYLAPEITEAILAGTQPAGLTMEALRDPMPLGWKEQRTRFGFAPAA